MKNQQLSRRKLLLGSIGTATGAVLAKAFSRLGNVSHAQDGGQYRGGSHEGAAHSGSVFGAVGTVDHERNRFHPSEILYDFNYGDRVYEEDGRTVREYDFYAADQEVEIAPGIFFPAWTYNGRIPGPTIRCTEGDLIRINFVNASAHPHTIHFHGIHTAAMDGVPVAANMQDMPTELTGPGMLHQGESFTYEFVAEPFGCHLYHCHSIPLKRHIHKGLYGAFIVDPPEPRPEAHEMVMVMNGFDTNFDGGNEIYAVNTIAFAYNDEPIRIRLNELVRIYLINIVEFDLINSFHLHANFFDYYDHGTTLEPTHRTVDTIMQAQAQRGIVEFSYKFPGMYMFHAHVSEFAELGWMGMFNVVEGDADMDGMDDNTDTEEESGS